MDTSNDASKKTYHVIEWDRYSGATSNPKLLVSTDNFAEAFEEKNAFLHAGKVRAIVKQTSGKIIEDE